MKKVAIVQSNYIPWKGYFDMIAAVDEFIFYDDMQITKNDWRNRNKIKTPNGLQWLSVPVGQNISRRIRDVPIPENIWQSKHWKSFRSNYSRARHFDEVASWLEPLYLGRRHSNLSVLNRSLILAICDYLNISTILKNSWDYDIGEGKSERLVSLCQQAGGDVYVSGPAARSYIDERPFEEAGIKIEWFDYSGYPIYPQLWREFTHYVSILDLIFNCGKDSHKFMKLSGSGSHSMSS